MTTVIDYANMSDDDLMNAAPPVVSTTGDADRQAEADRAAAEAEQAEADRERQEQEQAEAARLAQEEADRVAAEAGNTVEEGGNVAAVDDNSKVQKTDTTVDPNQPVKAEDGLKTGTDAADGKPAATTDQGAPAAVTEEPDYKGFHAALTAEFQANGKKLKFSDPKEIIQLMQMGANYTRKMQALAPQRRMLQMLENAGLANEQELSHFIDLKSGNQGAIAKLLKDQKFDIASYDENADPTYRAGNHSVDDATLTFNEEVQEVLHSHDGKATIALINGWDQASKNELWNDPSIMRSIHDQRQSGVYDVITAEVEKRRMLGQIPKSVGFLQAYNAVGNELVQAQKAAIAASAPAKPAPVTTTVAAPKPVVANAAAASAAGNTRSSGKKASQPVDFTKMSDAEIEAFDINSLKV